MKNLIKNYPVTAFILFAFLYSWTLWMLMILSNKGLLPFNFPTNFLGSFGPAVGGLIVTRIIYGGTGIKKIFKSMIDWKQSGRTYLFAFFFIFGVYILSIAISYLTDPSILKFQRLPGLAELILYFFVIAAVGGPLGEEIGWRGFLQPELLKRYNAINASLIIAVIWLTWHLPLFWLEGAAQKGGSIYYYALSVLAMSFLFTLLYIKSNGSLLLAILFHTMINYVSAFILPGILPSAEADKTFGHISTFILFGLGILFFLLNKKSFGTKQAA